MMSKKAFSKTSASKQRRSCSVMFSFERINPKNIRDFIARLEDSKMLRGVTGTTLPSEAPEEMPRYVVSFQGSDGDQQNILLWLTSIQFKVSEENLSELMSILFSVIPVVEKFSFDVATKFSKIPLEIEENILKKYLNVSSPFEKKPIEAKVRILNRIEFQEGQYNLFLTFDISEELKDGIPMQKNLYLVAQTNNNFGSTTSKKYDLNFFKNFFVFVLDHAKKNFDTIIK